VRSLAADKKPTGIRHAMNKTSMALRQNDNLYEMHHDQSAISLRREYHVHSQPNNCDNMLASITGEGRLSFPLIFTQRLGIAYTSMILSYIYIRCVNL
jgi:hypothetical protein